MLEAYGGLAPGTRMLLLLRLSRQMRDRELVLSAKDGATRQHHENQQ